MKMITTATGHRTGKVQEQRPTIGLDVGDRSNFILCAQRTIQRQTFRNPASGHKLRSG